MVSLQTLNGGTSGSKQWLNLVANSIDVNEFRTDVIEFKKSIVGREVFTVPFTLTAAIVPLTLNTNYFPSGVTVVNGTGGVICPSSVDIDTLLNITEDGGLIWQDFINRVTTGSQAVTPPNGGAAQILPNGFPGGKSCYTRLWFSRLNGIWTCLNS